MAHKRAKPHSSGQKIGDAILGAGDYGKDIGYVFGCMRIPAFELWQQITPNVVEVSEGGGGGKGSSSAPAANITKIYSGNFAVGFCLGPIFGIRKIWVDNTLIYNVAEDATGAALDASIRLLSSFLFYNGTLVQPADPLIAAGVGVANTNAYRGIACMSLNNYNWPNGRVPGLIAEVCEAGTAVGSYQIARGERALSTVLRTLCLSVGIPYSRIDVSEITLPSVKGIFIPGSQVREGINKLCQAYDLGVTDSGNDVMFYPLNRDVVLNIPWQDLDTQEDGRNTDPGDALKITDIKETELPIMIRIRAKNTDKDYLDINEQYKKASGTSVQVIDTDLGSFAASTTDLAQMAQRQMYRAYTERQKYSFFLPHTYIGIEPGDICTAQTRDGLTHTVRLTKTTFGANGVIECEAVQHSPASFSAIISGSDVSGGLTLADAGASSWLWLQLPPLHDAEALAPGVYVAATGASVGWTSAGLYQSKDGGGSYNAVLSFQTAALIGTCNTILGNGQTFTWDDVNTVTVTMIRGHLLSITDDQVLSGGNTALIGGELVQFASAILVGVGQYQLSRLLRGRRATEQYAVGHAASENFVLLTNTAGALASGVGFLSCNYSDLNRADLWKVVPNGHALADETAQSHLIAGENMLPFPPVSPSPNKDTTSGFPDLNFTWIRRSRLGAVLTPGQEIPLGETTERYHVQLLNPSNNVFRDIYVTTPSWAYVHADRNYDFGSPSASMAGCTFRVAQWSSTMGDGKWCTLALDDDNT